MKQDDLCCGHALQLQYSTFREIASSFPEICNFNNWLSFLFFFVFFFLFSHTYKNCYKMRTPYPISLKVGIQEGGIKAYFCTNFCWNMINRQRVIINYSRKITPICCHAYRVNRLREEAENRWVDRLTIEPQTFCGLKEIKLKTRKIQRKNQQRVTIQD